MNPAKNNPLPQLLLERALLGELPELEMKRIEKILAEDVQEKNRFEKLKKQNEEFFQTHPVQDFETKILERLQQEKAAAESPNLFALKKKILVFTPMLAAALVLLVFLPFHQTQIPVDPNKMEITRSKGLAPHLTLYRKTGSQVEILKQDSFARQGDQIQVAYHSAGFSYGVVFSIDGNGNITLHFPETGEALPLDQTRKEVLLPFAYELDNAPDFERFFLVVSKTPFSVQEILSKAKKMSREAQKNSGTLDLSGNFFQTSFLLRKGE